MKLRIFICILLISTLVAACSPTPGTDRFATQVANEIRATQTARAAGTTRYTPLQADTAARLQTLKTFSGDRVDVLAAASGAEVMVYAVNSGIHIVDLTTLAESGLISTPERMSILALSPDGRFAAGAGEADVYIWRLSDLTLMGTVSGASTNGLEFSADGRTLYGVNWDGVYGWQVPDGKQRFSSESLTDYYGNPIRGGDVFSLISGSDQILLADEITIVDGQDNPISLELDFTRLDPNGNFPVENWRLEAPDKTGDHFNSFAFSPDETRMAIGWGDHPVEIWKFDYGFELEYILPEETTGARQLAFSPDGESLGIGTWHSIQLWNLSARKTNAIWSGSQLAFLQGGDRLGLVTETDVRIVAISDQELLGSFPYSTVKDIRISPDSELIAVGRNNGEVEIWSKRGQQLTQTLAAGLPDISLLNFSPGGEYLAAYSSSGQAAVWNTSNWEPRPIPEEVLSPQFTHNGLLVSRGADPAQVLVLADMHDPLFTLPHAAPVVAIQVSPTEPIMAVLIEDWTIWLWDLSTGNFIDTLEETEGIELVGFSDNGQVLVTTSDQGVIKVWSVAKAQLLDKHDFGANIGYAYPAPSGEALVVEDYYSSASRLWRFDETQTTEVPGSFSGFSPSGDFFATIDYQVPQIVIWRTEDGSQVSNIPGYGYLIGFSKDENVILLQQFSSPTNPTPHLQAISVMGGAVLADIAMDGSFTQRTVLSEDGATLVGVTNIGNAYVWGVP